jgi:CheY-like chemotaxis protein
VDAAPLDGAEALRRLKRRPPGAIVIDLSRLPSHGREVALALREMGATRRIPIVFVEGAAEKVARVRALLSDAAYTTWRGFRGTLKRAIANPPQGPVAPSSRMAAYSGTPLPRKLGIKEGAAVGLLGAPDGFERTLGEIPGSATLQREPRSPCDLVVWFVRGRRDLERGLERATRLTGGGGLWIAWPKRASGVETDVTQTLVRERGLAAGLVDYKIAAIDATWSGLKFTRRR